MQRALQPGALLDSKGHLAQRGYAKKMIMDYDRDAIKANKFRIKEWDYYLITCDDYAIAATIDDNSYMGLMSLSILEFGKNPWEHTNSEMIWFPMGKVGFPSSSTKGDVSFANDKVDFYFENKPDYRRIKVSYKKFDGENDFSCDIKLTDIPEESMVIATPFKDKPKAFYFNQKIVGMKATGMASYKGKIYEFDEKHNSYGLLDWGRGVWTYDNTWYWSAAQTNLDGHTFGFNLGYGFGDTSAASENMLFYDGKAHKLEKVKFNIPKTRRGNDNFMEAWTFTSSDGRLNMKFVPILDRSAYMAVGPLGSDQHQVFGKFTGDAWLDDGTVIHVDNMLGFAEKVRNKW